MSVTSRLRPAFTIVELLIVIVVIAVLATVAIVAYSGIQFRAHAAAAQSDLAGAKKQLMLAQVDAGSFPTSTASLKASDGTAYELSVNNATSPQTFCLTGTNGNISYKVTESSAPVQGSCPGHGSNGVAAVTNLSTNPRGLNYGGSISPHTSTVLTKGVTVPATPDGITTAVEGRREGSDNWLFSVYNIDGLGITSGKTRTVSLWVRVNASGYTASGNGFSTTSLAPDVWIRLQSPVLVPTRWADIRIQKADPAPPEDRAWITGIMVVEGTQHYTFADGSSPNWIWNGTVNNSTSTGPPL